MKFLTIITGLPGSGKTYFANTFRDKSRVIHLDSDQLPHFLQQDTVIEGLLNINGINKILDYYYQRYSEERICVEIHRFIDNIPACLNNDLIRGRELSSANTIKHLEIITPSVESLRQRFQSKNWNFNITRKVPNITFLQYKATYKACVKIEERHERGYYGSYASYAQHICDLRLLYRYLLEKNLISEPIPYG